MMSLRMPFQTLTMVGALLLSQPVLAAPESYAISTGDELARVCADPASAKIIQEERERLLACGAYVRGYLGYYSASRSQKHVVDFCLPEAGVSPDQVRQLYVKVLQKKPELRDYPAAINLTSILKAAYPCNS